MTCPCLCHLIPSLKNHSTQAGVNNVSRLSHRFRAGVQQIPRPSDQVIPKCSKCYGGSNAFNISQCFRTRMLACLISISTLSSEKGISMLHRKSCLCASKRENAGFMTLAQHQQFVAKKIQILSATEGNNTSRIIIHRYFIEPKPLELLSTT